MTLEFKLKIFICCIFFLLDFLFNFFIVYFVDLVDFVFIFSFFFQFCHIEFSFLKKRNVKNLFKYSWTKWILIHYGCNILNTPLIKHFNDLLDTHRSERSWDEVTYFYVGDVFCIHPGTKYADFQEKIFAEISGKKLRTFGIT